MKTIIWKNYFDIVILPPKEVRDYAIKLSKQLYKYGTNWHLGRKSFLPHISLFHIPVKPDNFDRFIADLEKIIKNYKPGKLIINNLLIWEPHFSVMLMTDKPDWIKKFYLQIIKNNLRYFNWNYNIKKIWVADKLPKLCQKNLKRYGTPLVGRYFKPHITLGVFNNKEDMEDRFSRLELKKFSFKPDSIYVCQLGTNHSCQKIIRRISF